MREKNLYKYFRYHSKSILSAIIVDTKLETKPKHQEMRGLWSFRLHFIHNNFNSFTVLGLLLI